MSTIGKNPKVIKLNCSYPRTKDGEYYHIVKCHGRGVVETECGLAMKFTDERCVGKHVERFEDVQDESVDFHFQFCLDCFGGD